VTCPGSVNSTLQKAGKSPTWWFMKWGPSKTNSTKFIVVRNAGGRSAALKIALIFVPLSGG